jgi:hypothetical protein
MSLRERMMSSSFVSSERVYEFQGKWYYVSRQRAIEGPFQSEAQAQHALNCQRVLNDAALSRVGRLQLVPM